MPKRLLAVGIAVGIAISVGAVSGTRAFQGSAPAVALDGDDLAGTVTGPSGPEAGVWVIAETRDLPTPFAKIVVTDDRGRYLVPDLPKANYSVWVRGYGLVDSPKTQASPGRNLESQGRGREFTRGGGSVLPGRALAVADGDAGQERIPRHRGRAATASRRT